MIMNNIRYVCNTCAKMHKTYLGVTNCCPHAEIRGIELAVLRKYMGEMHKTITEVSSNKNIYDDQGQPIVLDHIENALKELENAPSDFFIPTEPK